MKNTLTPEEIEILAKLVVKKIYLEDRGVVDLETPSGVQNMTIFTTKNRIVETAVLAVLQG